MKTRKFNMTSRRREKRTLAENVRVVRDAPIHGSEYQPRVYLFYGRRGNGKSLLATAFAKTHADRWARAGAPKRVFTNYDVTFATHASENLYAEMTLGDMDCRHSIIVIDEVAEIMPSMRANTREALDIQTWLKAIRKQGVDVFLTTQRPHDTLGNIRYQTDMFISCIDPYRRDPKRKGRVVNASIFDWWGAISDNPFGARAHFPQPDENAHWRRRYMNLDRFWQYYDTEEVIRGTYATSNRANRARLLEQAEAGTLQVGGAKPKPPVVGEGGKMLYSQINRDNIQPLLGALREKAGNPNMNIDDALKFAEMMGDLNIR